MKHDENGVTIAGQRVDFIGLPAYVWAHLERVPSTHETEAAAHHLVAGGFQYANVDPFVRAVCKWGDYAGIAGRVLRHNGLAEIADAFRAAVADVPAGIDVAVGRVMQLRHLGLSFASKHLRFLAPRVCAILDSKMAAETGLPSSPSGLAQYSALCRQLAARAGALHIPNPMARPNGEWYAADVEMALFAVARGWAPSKRGLTTACS